LTTWAGKPGEVTSTSSMSDLASEMDNRPIFNIHLRHVVSSLYGRDILFKLARMAWCQMRKHRNTRNQIERHHSGYTLTARGNPSVSVFPQFTKGTGSLSSEPQRPAGCQGVQFLFSVKQCTLTRAYARCVLHVSSLIARLSALRSGTSIDLHHQLTGSQTIREGTNIAKLVLPTHE